MRVEDLFCMRPQRLDDIGAVRDVRNEMPVHHVEMDPVGPGRIDRVDLLAKPGKIRREDRWRDNEGTWGKGHGRLPARFECPPDTPSGADLTFATLLTGHPSSERQIQSSTRFNILLVVL